MKITVVAAVLASLCSAGTALAGDHATRDQAEAMVNKAVAYLKANGAEKAYAAFDDRHGQFVDRDLYIVVYGLDGKCLAHGGNAKMIGKEFADTQDVDGKYFIKERMDLAKTHQSFWQDYKFSNPVDKKIEPKQMFCERVDNSVVCGGIYKS